MSNFWDKLSQRWKDLSIARKFNVLVGVMQTFILLITVVSSFVVIIIRSETRNAIEISTEIQRLVLELDNGLEKARRLERDFFLHYPTIGYDLAYQESIQPAKEQIENIIQKSTDLQKLLDSNVVSEEWIKSGVNLNLILSAANRHADTVAEATDLVAKLMIEESKLIDDLSQIEEELQSVNQPEILVLFHEMLSFHRWYLLERRRPLMQSAFNMENSSKHISKQR